MRRLQQVFSGFAILLLLIFIPVYVENAYFNITGAKFRALLCTLVLLVIPILLFSAYRLIKRKEFNKMPLDLSEGALL